MMNYAKRGAALLLALVFCLGLLPPAGAEGDTITIHDASGLLKLAQSCTSDTWSQGVTVVLAADISLAGTGFSTIPVFRGTFDGAGHTISGFAWLDKGSKVGLFRTLGEGAVVKNLTLDGVVAPGGSQSQVGILAGENHGTVEQVTVTGDVTGDEDVGALVGVNGSSGVVRSCTNRASVTGNTNSGGIAGRNEGMIQSCTNLGEVNTGGNDAATNSGGIAGRNTGTVADCTNHAAVGYAHTGYNTGGIAGIQNGALLRCFNDGEILGRKDVGGIVGQFEPYVTLTYGEDPMERLDGALASLSTLMTQLSGQIHSSAGDAVDDISAIHGSLSAIQDVIHGTGSDFNTDTSAAADQVYDAVQTINGAMSGLLDEVDRLTRQASADLDEVGNQLTALRKGLKNLTGTLEDSLSDTGDSLSSTLDALEREHSGLVSELRQIADETDRLESFVKDALQAAARLDLAGILDAYKRWDVGSIDFNGHLSRISGHLEAMGSDTFHLADRLTALWQEAGDEMGDARRDMDRAARALEKALDALNGHVKDFSQGSVEQLRVVNSQADIIEDVLNGYLDTLGDKGQERLDELDGHLDDISQRVDQMTQGAGQTNQELHATTTAIIGQLDEARKAIVELTEVPEKTVKENTSAEGAQSGPGRVVGCRNEGGIQADTNVGGIAGAVSPELSLDPEENLELDSENLLVDTTALLKAILYQCDNRGPVTAKNECAGGVLGRGEVGAALSCTSMGPVGADDGSFAGGIAGLSRGVLRSCAAQADVTGDSSLGGIAGEGRDIADCIAMTRIDGSGERLGAVAGWADGTVSGNYYLQEKAVGIDGIDYAGQTAPLSFGAFSALEGIPADFLTFRVTFQAGEQVVDTVEVPYGGSLDPAAFPEVPSDGGRYGAWAPFDHNHITRSLTVEAVYEDWVTTISSGGERPLLLAEGAFSPDARLELAQRPEPVDGAAAYDYQITDGAELPDTVTLRVCADGLRGSVRAALLQDGSAVPIEAERDGSYLVLTAPTAGTLLLSASGSGTLLPWVLAAAAAAVLLALLFLRRRRKKTNAAASV